MKLLFLLYDYLPAFRPDVAVLFGKELPRLGVGSDLLGQRARHAEREPAGQWPAGKVAISGVERRGIVGELLRPLLDLAMLSELAPEHRIIQVRDKIRTGLLALLIARLTGRRFVYWMSFPFVEGFRVRHAQLGGSRGPIVQLLNWLRLHVAGFCYYRVLAPRADHLFVQSEAMLEFMAGKGIARSRMTAVPMGVDTELFASLPALTEKPARLAGRPVLAYLGALGQSRQSDFLLHVLQRVREQRPDALLLLIGEGASEDERQWIRARIAELGLEEHVWLTGWMAQPEALQLLRCADVGLSPVPRGELFDVSSPTKAVEYLALGLPCVGNDIPDQRLVLERSGAGLCVKMNAEDFAAASLRILGDAGYAAALRARGPVWAAENRSYRVLAQAVAKVYFALAGQAGGEEHK